MSFFKTFDSRHRLMVCVGMGMFVSTLLPTFLRLPTRLLCAWNSSAYLFLGLTWWNMVKSTPQKMRRRAKNQYEGRLAVFSLIIASACASLLAIGFILSNKKGLSPIILNLHLALSFATIVSSWLLVHTVFTMQYAYTYYQDSQHNSQEQSGGLDFPDENYPDYWDFLNRGSFLETVKA